MEFFGNQNGEDINDAGASQFSLLFGEISDNLHPTWQMISSNIFVYSAYCQSNFFGTSNHEEIALSCPVVKSIAIFRVPSSNVASQSQPRIICKFWYDDVREPKEGIPSVSRLGATSNILQRQDGENFRPYVINCENQFPSIVPYGISFEEDQETSSSSPVKDRPKPVIYSNNNKDYTGFIHVQPFPHQLRQLPSGKDDTSKEKLNSAPLHRKTSLHDVKRHPGIVACLGPSSTSLPSAISPQSLTEQVLLQNYFGVNNFIIYDSGTVSHRFLATVAERQLEITHSASGIFNTATQAKLSLNILPWNIPVTLGRRILSSEDELELAQTDCYFRTVNRYSSKAFESSMFLKPGQILVPKKTNENNVLIKSVPKLLKYTAAKTLSQGSKVSKKLMFFVRKFCAEYPSDGDDSNTKHVISALTKSSYNSELSTEHKKVSLTYFTHGVEQSEKEVDIEPEVALIHDYGPCGEIIDDSDDASEKTDKTLIERGHDIDESIGKYFQSLVMTKGEQEKIFRHKIKPRL